MSRQRLHVRLLSVAAAVTAALLLAGAAVAQEAAQGEDALNNGRFTLHFENVELPIFVKFIAKVTGRKFVFSDRVAGTVTVISPVPVTEREAVAMFESVLAVRDLTMIDDGIVTRIVPLKEALTAGGAMTQPGKPGTGFSTRLFPLRHVDADGIAPVLQPLVSKEGALVAYPATNTVIVSDQATNLMRIDQVVNALDIPSHEEAVEVIALKHADATALAEKLADILTEAPGAAAARGKEKAAGGAAAGKFKIVPDERTNSLIVIAEPTEERRIRSLAHSLDTPLEPGDQRINVYYARFANAVDLVDVLGEMLTGQRKTQQAARAPDGRTALPVAAGAASAAAIGPDVSISADPATNSVIIDASLQDYKMIRSLLESLDIERPQVFVEALVAEVSMARSRELGFEFQVGGDVGDGTAIARSSLSTLNPLLADPTGITGLIAAAVSDRTIELPDGTEIPAQVALFRALAADRDINVLSAPTLLTLDNQEARIVVGENVPFITSQGVDLASVDNVFTTVERRDVGIKLTITPQVSEGDVVILDLEEEVSALVPNELLDEQSVGPTTTVRSAETTVSVRDGRTAVIGGLISNSIQRRASKVPILGDIPVLGRLFRSDAGSDEKVNLIVFLTPHIIRNSQDLNRVSEQRRSNFHYGEPEADVPWPQTGQPYVIPGEPDPGTDPISPLDSVEAPAPPDEAHPVPPAAPHSY